MSEGDSSYQHFLSEPLQCIKSRSVDGSLRGYRGPRADLSWKELRLLEEKERVRRAKVAYLQKFNINGKYMHINDIPWWRKDKTGWPIETVKGKYVSNFVRLLFQNLRKLGF